MVPKDVMRILYVASECFPLIKTGGLADVVGALPLALMEQGHDVRVMLPAYPSVRREVLSRRKVASIKGGLFGFPASLYGGKTAEGLRVFMLDMPDLFGDEGNPYVDEKGRDRPDNHIRFAALSRAAAELASGTYIKWQPDIVHGHDWQAGLLPLYLHLKGGTRPKSVFTIHNLAFQGLFPKSYLSPLMIPSSLFDRDGVEYWGQIGFLKAGIVFSDAVTTVSPAYAAEIQTDELGMGLGGLLRANSGKFSGILNGIDTSVWDPEHDQALVAPYSAAALVGKKRNKKALQKRFGLDEVPGAPLFCVISRLTEQKGLDLVAALVPHIIGNKGQLMVLGSGDKALENSFLKAAKAHPGKVAAHIGYDEGLAHLVQAAADAIFIPSRYEPCGLTQLCAMRYGTVPIVSRVGGLSDTVIDANEMALQAGTGTGIQFSPVSYDGIYQAANRFLALYGDKKLFPQIVRRAMRQDLGWAEPSKAYINLYVGLLGGE